MVFGIHRRLSGERGPPGPLLPWRVTLLGLGAAVCLAGLYLESDSLILAAIGILFAGLILSAIGRRRH